MTNPKASLIIEVIDKSTKALNKIRAGVLGVSKAPFKAIGKGFSGISSVVKKITSLPSLVTTFALSKLSGEVIDVTKKFEQWEIAFTTLTGSAENAKRLLDDIKEFAAGTPFELPGLVDSSKKLLAFGFQQEEIIDTMRRLGDIAAGVGTDKLPTLVASLGKIRTKGRASLEELNMMLEAGVPILDSLAEGLEVSKEELFKMVSAGKIGFEDVNKAISDLTKEGSKFGGLMEKQSKSLGGILSNIKDNFTQVALAIGQEVLPEIKLMAEFMKDVTDTSNIPRFIADIKIFFIDLKANFKIGAETLKEVLSEPFKFETYSTVVKGLTRGMFRVWNAIKKIGQGGLMEIKKILEENRDDNMTLEEEIIKIKKDAADEKLNIEKQLLIDQKAVRAEDLEDWTSFTNDYVDIAENTGGEVSDVFSDMVKVSADTGDSIKDIFKSAFDSVAGFASNAFNGLEKIADKAGGKILSAVLSEGDYEKAIDTLESNFSRALRNIERKERRGQFDTELDKEKAILEAYRDFYDGVEDVLIASRSSKDDDGFLGMIADLISDPIGFFAEKFGEVSSKSEAQKRARELLGEDLPTEMESLEERIKAIEEKTGTTEKFHTGGIIGGPQGQERLIMGKAGETVLTQMDNQQITSAISSIAESIKNMGKGDIVIKINERELFRAMKVAENKNRSGLL
jgi:tape measure domain-containing protein